jgi:hypothetical protein
MSAKRSITVAEAMMRQSRRADGVLAFLDLLGRSSWMVPLEMAARLAEPRQVGLIGAIVFLGHGIDLVRFCRGISAGQQSDGLPKSFDPRDHQRRALTCAAAWWGEGRADSSYPNRMAEVRIAEVRRAEPAPAARPDRS